MHLMKIALLTSALALLDFGSAPAPAHTHTKPDPDDSASFLDLEEVLFCHEDGRCYFMVKTYDKCRKIECGSDHGLDIHMDTGGDDLQDYSIFVERFLSDGGKTLGAEEPESEVVARLGDWSVEKYIGRVEMERPTLRKTIF